jgi:uncharacterized Zn finger protein (UPF0148 family)
MKNLIYVIVRKYIKNLYCLSEISMIMMKRCSECRGVLIRSDYEVICKRCGLVIKDEPLCIGRALIFK